MLQSEIDNLGTGSPYPYDRIHVRGSGTIDVAGAFTAEDLPVASWFQLTMTPTGIALAVDNEAKGMISGCQVKTGFATYTSHRPADLSALISDQDLNTVTLDKSALPMTATANDSHEKIMAGVVKFLLGAFSQTVWDGNLTTIIRAIEANSVVGGAAIVSLAFNLSDLAFVWNDPESDQIYIPGTGAYGNSLPDGSEHFNYLLISTALPASVNIFVYTWLEESHIWEQQLTDIDATLLLSNFDTTGKTVLFEAYSAEKPAIEIRPVGLPIEPTEILFEAYSAEPPVWEVTP